MALRTLDELIEIFAFLGTWEDRYRYLIDIGSRLEPMDPVLKTEENLVKGCTSRAWIVKEEGDGKRFRFKADSEAQIVRGLIYVLMSAYQGKRPEDIARVDIQSLFERLGLQQNLSPNRRGGFFAMVERIKVLAMQQ